MIHCAKIYCAGECTCPQFDLMQAKDVQNARTKKVQITLFRTRPLLPPDIHTYSVTSPLLSGNSF